LSPTSFGCRYFGLMVIPSALNMSNSNIDCWWSLTVFSVLHSSIKYPTSSNVCINHWSRSRNCSIRVFPSFSCSRNLSSFSHHREKKPCVTLVLYFVYEHRKGCDEIPNSMMTFSIAVYVELQPLWSCQNEQRIFFGDECLNSPMWET